MVEDFRILVVCRANLCRSPMAERLAAAALGPRVQVASAGTHARDDQPMHPHAAEVLRRAGLLDEGFRSRRLDPVLLHGADLVLTASRAERAACVRLVPAAVGRTFTLLQFARLAAALPHADRIAGPRAAAEPLLLTLLAAEPRPVAAGAVGALAPAPAPAGGLAGLLAAVPRLRALAPAGDPAEEDLADPVGGPLTAFRDCAETIRRAVGRVAAVIDPR
ncbi:hypothetical protein GCM10010123_21680 [Pilimelia anulata]|uniref:protein-tyrosine-phosphatase n=1 Tax=Pilimelia anulata TaxID=53371 RepID=A0A8J3B2V7_9ACTN|nr:low molecular weight phosphatase family protein [Pilimelia anulata]GGJ91538.1 hypothetical protein GCM10010123_21680 [Pilimelia anulata]